jgi:hypothetical protein
MTIWFKYKKGESMIYLVVEQNSTKSGYVPIKAFNIKYKAFEFAEIKQNQNYVANGDKEYFVLPIEYQQDMV